MNDLKRESWCRQLFGFSPRGFNTGEDLMAKRRGWARGSSLRTSPQTRHLVSDIHFHHDKISKKSHHFREHLLLVFFLFFFKTHRFVKWQTISKLKLHDITFYPFNSVHKPYAKKCKQEFKSFIFFFMDRKTCIKKCMQC